MQWLANARRTARCDCHCTTAYCLLPTAYCLLPTQELVIAFRANLRNPVVWQALIRLMTEAKVASLSARKTMVVGRPLAGVELLAGRPAG